MKARILFLNLAISLLITFVPISQVSNAVTPVQVVTSTDEPSLPVNPNLVTSKPGPAKNEPTVIVQAASGKTIEFWTQNGRTVDRVAAQRKDIPHLVLFRNGQLTESSERELTISVAGLDIPERGARATLKIETQSADPDQGGGEQDRFLVWQASQELPARPQEQMPGTLEFTITLPGTVDQAGAKVQTPTGYLRYEITLTDNNHPESEPLYQFTKEYGILLESQWIEPLPPVLEATPGAAPDELVLFYLDMTPFQVSANDPATRLPRSEVTNYIGNVLAPAMVTAYQQQSNGWGFPWFPDWTGYRSGEDAERLTVALSDGRTWFHGMAPSIGYGEISIKVSAGYGERADYASLTEKLLGPFHHELFHNLQRNISQQLAGSGDVDGKDNAWTFFSEGTAVLAASVGQPGLQMSDASGTRDYLFNANSFIEDDLNQSYTGINPYHAALYWRFLYEQCGGLHNGEENPAAGMQIVRKALETLYSGEVVDIQESSYLVTALPKVMDRAIAGTPTCPFKDYRDSLTRFARAIYSLRLDAEPEARIKSYLARSGGDYREPEAAEIDYSGEEVNLSASIPSSFGMDFVELQVEPAVSGKLSIEVVNEAEDAVRFYVEVIAPEENWEAGSLTGEELEMDIDRISRLGLIITRLDSSEGADPAGLYTIRIRPVVAGN